jgi:hypothetical protein
MLGQAQGHTAVVLFQDFLLKEEVLIIPGDMFELQTLWAVVHTVYVLP